MMNDFIKNVRRNYEKYFFFIKKFCNNLEHGKKKNIKKKIHVYIC